LNVAPKYTFSASKAYDKPVGSPVFKTKVDQGAGNYKSFLFKGEVYLFLSGEVRKSLLDKQDQHSN